MANRILRLSTLVVISFFGLSIAAAQESQAQPANSGPPPANPFAPSNALPNQPPSPGDEVAPSADPPAPEFSADPVPPDVPAAGLSNEPIPPRRQPRQTAPASPQRPVRGSASDHSGVSLSAVVHKPVAIYDARELVLSGNVPAAKAVLDTLIKRYPTDARVPYLRYILQYYTGQPKEALTSLEHAIALEYYRPVRDYQRFMEPIQGSARIYAERVRQSVARLDSMGKLEIPPFEKIIAPSSEHDGMNKQEKPGTKSEEEASR